LFSEYINTQGEENVKHKKNTSQLFTIEYLNSENMETKHEFML